MCQEGPMQSPVKWGWRLGTDWHGFQVNRLRLEAFSPNEVTYRIKTTHLLYCSKFWSRY